MGTDIHAIYQKRTESGWEDVPYRSDSRDEFLFAWLADVGNIYGIKPLSTLIGFPADFEVVEDRGSYTYHRHPVTDPDLISLHEGDIMNVKLPGKLLVNMGNPWGWLLDDDILNAIPPTPPEEECGVEYFVDEIRQLKNRYGNVRMVFGFES